MQLKSNEIVMSASIWMSLESSRRRERSRIESLLIRNIQEIQIDGDRNQISNCQEPGLGVRMNCNRALRNFVGMIEML